MENSLNQLVIDQRIEHYRSLGEIQDFGDMLADSVSAERVAKELSENGHAYYNNALVARNALIRRELEEKGLFVSARHAYATETCEKVLQLFRRTVFVWSQDGKKYANVHKDIHEFDTLAKKYIVDLYSPSELSDIEEVKKLLDHVYLTMHEEFHTMETVRSCANFYHTRPAAGKHPFVYAGCIDYIRDIIAYAHDAGTNEMYFQNAAQNLKQYRETLDPVKEASEDFKMFISLCGKTSTELRHDIRETLAQYITIMIQTSDMQAKASKNDVEGEMTKFMQGTGYTLKDLGYDVHQIYNNNMDSVMFKQSGS